MIKIFFFDKGSSPLLQFSLGYFAKKGSEQLGGNPSGNG